MTALVALFAYARPAHLARVLHALAANPEASGTELHIYCDGPSGPAVEPAVAEVRRLARRARGFRAVRVVERDRNLGLHASITGGVAELLEGHERLIVLEDDLVVGRGFLGYMNRALDVYAGREEVASVHAYVYPVGAGLPETFFLRGADCWGWGTWRRAWRHFRADGAALAEELRARGLVRAFDLDGAYPFYRMLRRRVAGRNDSWAILWHASAYLAGMYTLYPGRSLVENIGLDGSGSHCRTRLQMGRVSHEAPRVEPRPVVEDATARRQVAAYLRRHRRALWKARLRRLLPGAEGREGGCRAAAGE